MAANTSGGRTAKIPPAERFAARPLLALVFRQRGHRTVRHDRINFKPPQAQAPAGRIALPKRRDTRQSAVLHKPLRLIP